MTAQSEDVGASSALIGQGKEEWEQNQNTESGINIFDNPFSGISAQDCVIVLREILGSPDIPLEIKDIRITQLENSNPQGQRLCYREGVLPYKV